MSCQDMCEKKVPHKKNIPLSLGMNTFIGRSMSGKTYLLQKLIKEKKNSISSFVVFSYNKITLSNWKTFFLEEKLEDTFTLVFGLDEQVIDKVEKYQTQLKASGNEPPIVMFILDDVMAVGGNNLKVKNTDIFNHLSFNSRHYNIVSCTLLQDIVGMSRSQFSNCGSIVLFGTSDYYLRENHFFPKIGYSVLHQFGEELSSKGKNVWNSLLHTCFNILERYEALVFIRDCKTNKNFVYRYKADG